MAIRFQVLGKPGWDNGLYVELDTGQAIHRFLFDCGHDCLDALSVAQIQSIDGLMFSHFHVDHVAGFDAFLRCNYARPAGPVRMFGPPDATRVLAHRLQGFTWNLVQGSPGEFLVTAIHPDRLVQTGFLTHEAFKTPHARGESPFHGTLLAHHDYRIDAMLLDHGTPSAAYCIREADRWNVDMAALQQAGLPPGPWLKSLKDPAADPRQSIRVGDATFSLEELRKRLVTSRPGDSIAYVTDFLLNPETESKLVQMLAGCQTLVCEASFANAEHEQSRRTFHPVSDDVGRLAAQVKPQRLILLHLSDRYTPDTWRQQLAEVRAWFPETHFSKHWRFAEEK